MTIKTVFFDLGNVLIFFSHEKMCSQIALCSGIPCNTVKKTLFEEKLFQDYETGKIDTQGVYQFFQDKAPKFFTLHEFMQATSDIFTPNTALWPIVKDLKTLGLRLVILSNISECHFNTVYARYPVLKAFDDKTLSFEVGAMKPDQRIFADALSKAKCLPQECFYTDDIPQFIQAAQKSGFDGEVFVGAPQLKEALVKRGVPLP